jgi:hypothetical protein
MICRLVILVISVTQKPGGNDLLVGCCRLGGGLGCSLFVVFRPPFEILYGVGKRPVFPQRQAADDGLSFIWLFVRANSLRLHSARDNSMKARRGCRAARSPTPCQAVKSRASMW